MTKKIILKLAVVASAALVVVPAASASCLPDKSASTYGASLAYWHAASTAAGTLLGQTWQLGAPGVWNNGAGATDCNGIDQGSGSPGFLYFAGSNDKIGLNLHMGTCGAGCPAGLSTVAVAAYKRSATGTELLVATIGETPAGVANFDFSTQGDHNLVPLPRPRVTTSSRAGNLVNVAVAVSPVSAGLYGPNAGSAITGYNILSAQSATDPGRNAAAYSLRSSIPAAGGAAGTSSSFSVDCTNTTQDQWVVTQINFENGGLPGNSVSAATRINCNPALADPKFTIVPKKHDTTLTPSQNHN